MLPALLALLSSPVLAQDAEDQPVFESLDIEDVVGGSVSPEGKWPDAAAIVFNSQYVGCTGTLVAPNVVLTAGHCIGGISHVIVNTVDYTDPNGRKLVEVRRQYAYPNSQSTYDAAVLLLAEDVEGVEPRMIAQDCIIDDYLANGEEVVVAGWGATQTNGGGGTYRLLEGTTLVQTKDCTDRTVVSMGREIYTGCNTNLPAGSEIGAGGLEVDACYGDSGGPLYYPTDRGDYLIGITSRSYYGVPSNAPCYYGGIYVRPDALIDWIEERSGVEFPHPSCNDAPAASDAALTVEQGATGSAIIEASDPDGEIAAWVILEEPEHGTATIDETGTVTYVADEDYIGADSLIVGVTDDGSAYEESPEITVEATLEIDVIEKERRGGCACSVGAAPSFGAFASLLGFVALVRRRRA